MKAGPGSGARGRVGARSSVPIEVVRSWGRCARDALDPDGLVVKTLAEDPTESLSEVLGDRRPPLIIVREGSAAFECRLDNGLQTGLFLDHRHTRWRAIQYAKGVRVLNLFAYTCSFSVQAALAGAEQVTSVDVSQRALSWGRRNMAHSGLDPNAHRWFGDDAMIHVRRPRRAYGLVIVDPPAFGHGRRPFSLLRDLEPLVRGSLEQLHDEGVIIVSSHHQDVSAETLASALHRSAEALGSQIEVLERLGLPSWDHPVVTNSNPEDRGDYLDTLIARLHRAD